MQKRIGFLLLFVMIIFVLLGCSANGTSGNRSMNGAGSSNTQATVDRDVSIEEALRLWQNKEVIMLDVRTPAEYEQGHIPGIMLIPLDQLLNRISEVPKDKKVLVICRSGSRSSEATKLLRDHGYSNAFNVTSGMMQWKGLVETGSLK